MIFPGRFGKLCDFDSDCADVVSFNVLDLRLVGFFFTLFVLPEPCLAFSFGLRLISLKLLDLRRLMIRGVMGSVKSALSIDDFDRRLISFSFNFAGLSRRALL